MQPVANMDALAEAAAQAAQKDAEQHQGNQDVLGMSNWLRTNAQKQSSSGTKPKDQSRDPNLGTEADGPQITGSVDTYKPESPVADDGQSLSTQTPATQEMFRTRYGLRADVEWAKEHNTEIGRQRAMFGVSKPPSWMQTKPSSGTGTLGAAPTTAVPTTSSGQRVAFLPKSVATYRPPTSVQPGQSTTTFDPQTPGDAQAGAVPVPGQTQMAPSVSSTSTVQTAQIPVGAPPKPTRPGDWILTYDKSRTTSPYMWNLRDNYTAYPGTQQIVFDPQKTTVQQSAPTGSDGSLVRMGNTTGLPEPQTANPVTSSINIDSKPVDTLAQMSIRRQGGDPSAVNQESQRILQGIGSLIRGEKNGAWAEPYLNDIARVAWARQARASGENVDPRQAPAEYIERWKDAFYGSDSTVPLVKDLDQQMIDNAVSRTTTGETAFDWKKAYGDTGESGLISRQVASNDCGPNAFSTILRARGYNIDPGQAFDFAKEHQYHNGDQFNGPAAMATMLQREAGLDARNVPLDWKTVDSELDAGRPVALSSSTHWWNASAYRDTPQGREYYVGATGAVAGNPVWARADQLSYAGASPNALVVTTGDVDPNSRAVQELGLRPPGVQGPSRANLTRTPVQVQAQNPTGYSQIMNLNLEDSASKTYAPLIQEAATAEKTDPGMVAAILEQESGGKPDALSSQGAGGLMQIMPDTARGLGVQDVNDPAQSIRGGAKYFKQMMDMFDNNVDMALAAYNAGPGAVIKYGGVPPYEETQRYVREVKERYQRLTSGGAGVNQATRMSAR